MEVSIALLADYANVAEDGKLNLLGLFDRINAPVFPWAHPQMRLVLSLQASPTEYDTTKNAEIKLLDADGNTKFTITSEVKIPRDRFGQNVSINGIIAMNNILFDTEGDYAFHVLIEGEDKKRIPLRLNHVPLPQPEPK